MDEIRDEKGIVRKGIVVMERYEIFSIFMVILGFAIFIMGIFFLDFIPSLLGGLLIGLSVLTIKLKESQKKEKSILKLMEKREGSVLSKTKVRREKILPLMTSIIITVIIFAILYILLRRNFLGGSDITLEKAINDGCTKLKVSGCVIESTKVFVPYDVNKDGYAGRSGDSLYNILNIPPNACNETCVRKLCDCS